MLASNSIAIYIMIQKQYLHLDSTQIQSKATKRVIIIPINQILSYGCAVYNKTTLTVRNIVNENKAIWPNIIQAYLAITKHKLLLLIDLVKHCFNHSNVIIDVCSISRWLSICSSSFSGFEWFSVQQHFMIEIFNFIDYLMLFWIDCKRMIS